MENDIKDNLEEKFNKNNDFYKLQVHRRNRMGWFGINFKIEQIYEIRKYLYGEKMYDERYFYNNKNMIRNDYIEKKIEDTFLLMNENNEEDYLKFIGYLCYLKKINNGNDFSFW